MEIQWLEMPHSNQIIFYGEDGKTLAGLDLGSKKIWALAGEPQPSAEVLAVIANHQKLQHERLPTPTI